MPSKPFPPWRGRSGLRAKLCQMIPRIGRHIRPTELSATTGEVCLPPFWAGATSAEMRRADGNGAYWLCVRIVWIACIHKAGARDQKSFHLTDRFGDHVARLSGQKLVL
jgi:hypothetical protein